MIRSYTAEFRERDFLYETESGRKKKILSFDKAIEPTELFVKVLFKGLTLYTCITSYQIMEDNGFLHRYQTVSMKVIRRDSTPPLMVFCTSKPCWRNRFSMRSTGLLSAKTSPVNPIRPCFLARKVT